MSRPLIITDCDEVLMHMVVPFAQWVDAEHDIIFKVEDASFANALKRKACGTPVEAAAVWPLLDAFFTHEMGRQRPIAGAVAAMQTLQKVADIVVLTNVGPEHQQRRVDQLAAHGLHFDVIGSRGGKGEPVRDLVSARTPSVAIFIDDLAQHHHSVAEHAPSVWRLHMVGEPVIAGLIGASRSAHARIDDWTLALDWIQQRLTDGVAAPISVPA